jgi:hypothetical protein
MEQHQPAGNMHERLPLSGDAPIHRTGQQRAMPPPLPSLGPDAVSIERPPGREHLHYRDGGPPIYPTPLSPAPRTLRRQSGSVQPKHEAQMEEQLMQQALEMSRRDSEVTGDRVRHVVISSTKILELMN